MIQVTKANVQHVILILAQVPNFKKPRDVPVMNRKLAYLVYLLNNYLSYLRYLSYLSDYLRILFTVEDQLLFIIMN